MTAQPSIEDRARTYAKTASQGFRDSAEYLRALPAEEWEGPTGCSEWSVYDLAGHIVGEVVWFPNLVRGVTQSEQPLPMGLYTEMKSWPPRRLVDRIEEAAAQLWSAIDEATTEQLGQTVDLGFTRLPMWRATSVSASEGVFHNWDLRVRRDPVATIPTPWAVVIARGLADFAPLIADRNGAAEASGSYLLQVGDGVGPVTVRAQGGTVTVEEGARGMPDVTLGVTADQYDRLVYGRLDLAGALERGAVTVEGERSRATGLNRIFQGV